MARLKSASLSLDKEDDRKARPLSKLICADLRVEVGPPMATQEGAVLVLGKVRDVRTRNIVFGLNLSSTSTGLEWKIEKEFNEYEQLNEALKSRHLKLPEFPRKRHVTHFIKYSEKSDYWKTLGEGLQAYFNALLSEESIRADPELQQFLQPDTSKPAPLLVNLEAPQKDRDGGFEYPMTVTNEHLGGRLEWSLTKTHAEFVKFDERMRKRFQDKDLPSFPRSAGQRRRATMVLKYGSEEEMYKVRSQEIQLYLNKILSDDTLTNGSVIEETCIRELLDISDPKLRMAQRTARQPTAQRNSATAPEDGGGVSPSTPAAEPGTQSEPIMGRLAVAPQAVLRPPGVALERESRPQEELSVCHNVRLRLDGCTRFFRQAFQPTPASH